MDSPRAASKVSAWAHMSVVTIGSWVLVMVVLRKVSSPR